MMLRYVLEVPIDPRDAKRRGLSRDLSKLLTFAEKESASDDTSSILSEILIRLRRPGAQLYAQPVASYERLDSYSEALQCKQIEHFFDSGYQAGKCREPQLLTIQCDDPTKIRFVLTRIKAEALVFFSNGASSPGNPLENVVLTRRWGSGYDQCYLSAVADYGIFAFFESRGSDLEFLGTRAEIMRMFTESLEVEGRELWKLA